jgi:hypothetical protein
MTERLSECVTTIPLIASFRLIALSDFSPRELLPLLLAALVFSLFKNKLLRINFYKEIKRAKR